MIDTLRDAPPVGAPAPVVDLIREAALLPDQMYQARQALDGPGLAALQAREQTLAAEIARRTREDRIAALQTRLPGLATTHDATTQLATQTADRRARLVADRATVAAQLAALDTELTQCDTDDALAAHGLEAVAREVAEVQRELAALQNDEPAPAPLPPPQAWSGGPHSTPPTLPFIQDAVARRLAPA